MAARDTGPAWDETLDATFPASDSPASAARLGPPLRPAAKERGRRSNMGGMQAEEPAAGRMRHSLEPTAGVHLRFDLAEQIQQLQGEQPWQAGRNAKTIVKFPDFRLVLIAMRAGTRIPGHHADGRICVHAITGQIRLHLPDGVFDLAAGQLLALDRAVAHDVEALADSAFLLTIAWPGPGHHDES
jgi:quercetin dioxygenase-like cupin family protein